MLGMVHSVTSHVKKLGKNFPVQTNQASVKLELLITERTAEVPFPGNTAINQLKELYAS